MSYLRFVGLLCLVPLVSSCSLLQPRTQDRSRTTVRDVPFKARAGTGNLKKRVILLPFIDEKPGRSKNVALVARRSVARQLIGSRQLVVIRNSDFPQDLSKFLTKDRQYDMEAISKIAASMGVAAIIEGKIMEVRAKRIGDEVGIFRKVRAQAETTVRIRVASSRNGKILMSDVRKGFVETETTRVGEYSYSDRHLEEDPKLIEMSVRKAFAGSVASVFKSVEKMSWEGRIAMVAGEKIYVNAGRLSGIQIGDVLKILDMGDEVFDPETGVFIGRAPGRMKGTVEVVSYFGRDGAVSIIHSGSGFKENDRVELY